MKVSIQIFHARFEEGQASASGLNLKETNLQLIQADYEVNKKDLLVRLFKCFRTIKHFMEMKTEDRDFRHFIN